MGERGEKEEEEEEEEEAEELLLRFGGVRVDVKF